MGELDDRYLEDYAEWGYSRLYDEAQGRYQEASTIMENSTPGTAEYNAAEDALEEAWQELKELKDKSDEEIIDLMSQQGMQIPEDPEEAFWAGLEAVLTGERMVEIDKSAQEMIKREYEQIEAKAWKEYDDLAIAEYEAYKRCSETYSSQEASEAALEEYIKVRDALVQKQMEIYNIQQGEDEYFEDNIERAQRQLLEEYMDNVEEICVRGAMMRCKCGTHYRRLNLPVGHGAFENDRPKVNMNDMEVGADKNIPYFGVCKGEGNPGTAETVVLVNDCPRDAFGKKIGESDGKNVKGTKCTPMIIGKWQNPHEECIVDGASAITPCSYLICQYGGIIEIVDSGQHDEETKI